MNYFIKEKNGNVFQINNDNIIEQLNDEKFELGMKLTVFGTVPHYITVDGITEDIIYFKDDLWS